MPPAACVDVCGLRGRGAGGAVVPSSNGNVCDAERVYLSVPCDRAGWMGSPISTICTHIMLTVHAFNMIERDHVPLCVCEYSWVRHTINHVRFHEPNRVVDARDPGGSFWGQQTHSRTWIN